MFIVAYSSRGYRPHSGGDMAAGRGMTAEQEARWAHCIHSQKAESEQEVGPDYKTSRPTARIQLIVRFHLLKIVKPSVNRATSW